MYKLVTKLIAMRLKSLMPKLIGAAQCSFVPGRQSTDNILIAQEVVHSMRIKKGNVGFMAIKVDLEKAYDRLNWEFIIDTLTDVGLPANLIEIIMWCVTSSDMQLLWNGGVTDSFLPSRGIRQGDPMSPYLFVLCIERLAQFISLAASNGLWEPISISKRGPKLSHLCFADDLILFAKASMEQVQVVKGILDLFCASSGQKVNNQKSCVFFSKNVSLARKQDLSNALGMRLTSDLGKYLGIPLFHERCNKKYFQFIIDKMSNRLSCWKARTLSLAGRITLAQSALASIPSYVM